MSVTTPTASKKRLLDLVTTPEDLRRLAEEVLPKFAAELRQETIDAGSVTRGH
jgi:1-deoxy-D-xylulose-5-phosphate synthase